MSGGALVAYTPPSGEEWDQLVQTAKMVTGTDFVPKSIRNSTGAIMASILTGRELGIGPMQALRDIFIVEGTPTMKATLMKARATAAGHRVKTVESTDQRCTVQIRLKGETEPEPPVTWTIEMAKRAKLAHKDNWTKYPEGMLWSRAISAAVRRDCPEVLGAVVYTPEEIESIDPDSPATEVSWGAPEVDGQSIHPSTPATGAPSTGAPRAPSAGVGTQSATEHDAGRKGKTPASGEVADPTSEAAPSAPPGSSLGDNGDTKTRGTPSPDSVPPTTAAREPEDRLAPAPPSPALEAYRDGLAKLGLSGTDAAAMLTEHGTIISDRWWDDVATWDADDVEEALDALKAWVAERGETS